MAERKEIHDFIMAERNMEVSLSEEDVTTHTLQIIEIYNERKADLLTLKNDLWELMASLRLLERRGAEKKVTYDFMQIILILLQTAKDWHIFLPETEVKRYEGIKLGDIENLADYIRKLGSESYEDIFKWKYSKYIIDIDVFMEKVHTMKPKEIGDTYKSEIKNRIAKKEYVEDVLKLIPERGEERGMTLENLRKKC